MSLTSEQLKARREELLDKEKNQPLLWWNLSFVGENGWLGGVFAEAPGFVTALALCDTLGINPGGEVQGIALPYDLGVPRAEYCYRLITTLDELNDAEPIARSVN
jgi:hypothetical protein